MDELIISEYSDGSGNNDCIEIFNGTGNPINLYAEGYTLRFYYNGNTTYTQVSLLGTVADRDVYVICNPFGPGASQAHQTGGFGFDGNDAIVLSKAGNAIDIIEKNCVAKVREKIDSAKVPLYRHNDLDSSQTK